MTTTTTRRAILAGIATAPVFATPAIAEMAEPDPIFALLEEHRLAYQQFDENCSGLHEEDTEAAKAEYDRLHNAEDDAAGELCWVEPTTLAGCVALLRYTAEFVEGERREWADSWVDENGKQQPFAYFLNHNIADALERLAVPS